MHVEGAKKHMLSSFLLKLFSMLYKFLKYYYIMYSADGGGMKNYQTFILKSLFPLYTNYDITFVGQVITSQL